jgi:hypothetical protein
MELKIHKSRNSQYYISNCKRYLTISNLANALNIPINQLTTIYRQCNGWNGSSYIFNAQENAEMALTMIRLIQVN